MRIRSIPPITSTGSNRRATSARLDGLAHMSIGRYMSEKRKAEGEESSWDLTKYSKSDFNKRTKKKITPPIFYQAEQIKSITDLFHNYNDDGDLAIILEFSGFEFLNSAFNRIDGNDDARGYFIPISYKGKISRLYLTTAGDIFEFKILNAKDDCIFGDDICIPELLQEYNSLSMSAILKNNWIIVTYKKYYESTG